MRPRALPSFYAVAVLFFLVLAVLSLLDTRDLLRAEGVGRATRDAMERVVAVETTSDELIGTLQAYLLSADPVVAQTARSDSQALASAAAAAEAALSPWPALGEAATTIHQLCAALQAEVAVRLAQPVGGAAGHPEAELVRTLAAKRTELAAVLDATHQRLGEVLAAERLEHRKLRDGSVAVAAGGVVALGVILVIGYLLLMERAKRKAIEEDHNRFFDLSIDLFCIANIKGYFTRVNPSFTRLLGYSVAELTTRPIMAFVHPDDRERSLHELARIGTGRDLVEFENRYLCKDGSCIWLMWNCKSYPSQQLLFGTARDITGRKLLEAQLRQQEQNLQRALAAEQRSLSETRAQALALTRSNRELKEFAHVAAHDLQEPLRMVSSYCAMLGESYQGKLGPDADEIIALAVDGAKRMQVLIQDMLLYARVDAPAAGLAPASLEQAVGEARRNLTVAIEESRGIISCEALPMVMADPRQLVQLLQNLIGNALKYRAKQDPHIRITAAPVEAGIRISVADNGIGIAPRHHERVFGMFKRLHTRDKYEGTGIGLALCRKIVEVHGGTIWVESSGEGGSTFHFTLGDPQRQPAAPGPAPAPAPVEPSTEALARARTAGAVA